MQCQMANGVVLCHEMDVEGREGRDGEEPGLGHGVCMIQMLRTEQKTHRERVRG